MAAWGPGLASSWGGLVLSNLCLAALNMLAADMRPGCWLGQTQRPTAPQKAVQQHIARRCACFLQKLQSRDTPNFGNYGSFQHFESKPSSKYPTMQAEKVDLPARAATCDPEKLLPPELADSVMDVEKMFPFCMPVQPGPVGPEGAERAEYVKLVFRQLQCGKTLLRLQCKVVGDVFCVAKSHGKQREIWNDSMISQVVARPPGPAKLANPQLLCGLVLQGRGASVHVKAGRADFFWCPSSTSTPSEVVWQASGFFAWAGSHLRCFFWEVAWICGLRGSCRHFSFGPIVSNQHCLAHGF